MQSSWLYVLNSTTVVTSYSVALGVHWQVVLDLVSRESRGWLSEGGPLFPHRTVDLAKQDEDRAFQQVCT